MSDDFQLTCEFPTFAVVADPTEREWVVDTGTPFYSRLLNLPTAFYNETTIDLSGRTVLKDETIFFRSSFEQKAGYDSIAWRTQGSLYEGAIEITIISSVPLSEENLIAAVFAAPGFIPPNYGYDAGTFDRSSIIHGRTQQHHLNTVSGHQPLTETGSGYLFTINDNYWSSLEPTAADTLYCYRMFNLSDVNVVAGPAIEGANVMTVNSKRVILDCMSKEEPQLEYMMRLKRSYELANQV